MVSTKVIEFIKRRFPTDCNWTTGNCYYFVVILKNRFPDGDIVYDLISGHFLFWYHGKMYDYNGVWDHKERYIINWNNFDSYDSNQKKRIIEDCIM